MGLVGERSDFFFFLRVSGLQEVCLRQFVMSTEGVKGWVASRVLFFPIVYFISPHLFFPLFFHILLRLSYRADLQPTNPL